MGRNKPTEMKKIAFEDLEIFTKGWEDADERVKLLMQKAMDLKEENASLLGHVRRLEKSNQELGEELHRCKNPDGPKGWN